MKESFRVGAALSFKTLYKNVALAECHLVSKFFQSRDLRTSADLIHCCNPRAFVQEMNCKKVHGMPVAITIYGNSHTKFG